jgi:hypothetical protein
MTETDPMRDPDLDAALADLARRGPRPGAALLARVLADAEAAQPRRRSPAAAPRWWRPAWPAGLVAGGLAAALLAGVWVGTSPPAPLLALEEALLGAVVVIDLAANADDFPPL